MYKLIRYSSGYTLMELMVTITIAGILLSIAIPNFTSVISSNRLTTYANELVTALNLARSEAIKRGQPVTIRHNGSTSGDWSSGWTVFTDWDGDGTLDVANADTLLRTYAALPTSFTLRGTYINYITYQALGTSANGSFIVCDNSDNNNKPEANTSRLIIVFMGRVRMGLDANNDGIPNTNSTATATSNITSCIP
jgi:type IV fimbrial biogenesis protein FimT